MKRVTISLSEDTYNDLTELSKALGCSRSALTEVVLARGMLKHYRARLAYAQSQAPSDTPIKRYRGQSIREIEEEISWLETNYQGELWDAVDQHIG